MNMPVEDIEQIRKTYKLMADEINRIRDMLEVIETEIKCLQEVNRWIPVSERLPEMKSIEIPEHKVSDLVLVNWFRSCQYENSECFGETWRTTEKAWVLNDIWMTWNGDEIKINDPNAPTHWRKLLPLPKEGEE